MSPVPGMHVPVDATGTTSRDIDTNHAAVAAVDAHVIDVETGAAMEASVQAAVDASGTNMEINLPTTMTMIQSKFQLLNSQKERLTLLCNLALCAWGSGPENFNFCTWGPIDRKSVKIKSNSHNIHFSLCLKYYNDGWHEFPYSDSPSSSEMPSTNHITSDTERRLRICQFPCFDIKLFYD